MTHHPRIAILIPCYNEELTIERVVCDFRAQLPGAAIYVYDNNSVDGTVQAARAAGAQVRRETRQGKGYVVRRMFRDIDADFYLMVDGDDTYEAAAAARMLELALDGGFDLVNGRRIEVENTAYRGGHRWGNAILTGVVRGIFGRGVEDMLSGYKLLSRRFVKSFPVLAQGFDIETELAVHALELSMPIAHADSSYRGRPEGSQSKLNTYGDGLRIAWMILKLVRHERPMLFFGLLAALAAGVSVLISIPLMLTYLKTGLVPRFPTAILSTGIMLLAALSFLAGLILDTVSRGRREMRLLFYLQFPPYQAAEAR